LDPATSRLLRDGASRRGVDLADEQVQRLERYLTLLQEWNRRINLTAIDDERGIVELHFLDSLAITPLIRDCRTLLDVGSGAGFPGAVLAIALPGLKVTAIDAVAKKVAFLQTLRRTVVPNLEPLHLRDEQLGTRTFDAAVSRATWDPRIWLQHGASFVAPNGLLIAMQTGDAPTLETPDGFTGVDAIEYVVADARRRIQPFRRG
jgi:16S rRNA (guanine527-N7)-methyltransferase